MTTLSFATHVVASLVIIAATLGLWSLRISRRAYQALAAGFAILTISLGIRWVVTAHPPLFGTFENAAAATWFLVAAVLTDHYLLSDRFMPGRISAAVASWAVPLLAFGAFFNPDPYPLTISERSVFIDLHVLLAWCAHTILLVGGTAALLRVVGQAKDIDEGTLHQLIFRSAGFGLAFFTGMIAIGSLYDFMLFSTWFTWEIVEVFAVAAWIAYASVIHAVMFFGWRGARVAWAMIAASILMFATFWVWSFYTDTYHHFEIPALRAGSITTQ